MVMLWCCYSFRLGSVSVKNVIILGSLHQFQFSTWSVFQPKKYIHFTEFTKIGLLFRNKTMAPNEF